MKKLLLTITALIFATGIGWAQTFTEITAIEELETGEYLIFGGNTKNMMSTDMGSNIILHNELSTEMGEQITAGFESKNIFTITVDGGDITIYHADVGYVSWGKNGATGNNANFYNDEPEDNEIWTASISDSESKQGVWVLKNGNNDARILQWNLGAPRFAAYTGSQQYLRLFKKTSDQAPPTLVANPSTLTGFTYMETEGPSDSQSFELSAENLDGEIDVWLYLRGNVTPFEISKNNIDWSNSLSFEGFDGDKVDIYVRLMEGLTPGSHEDEIGIVSDDLDDATVNVSGSVTEFFEPLDADFTETFTNYGGTGSYQDGSFQGDNDISWTYKRARGDQALNGKAFMLGAKSGSNIAELTATIPNGIDQLAFYYYQSFSNAVAFEVEINGQDIKTVTGESSNPALPDYIIIDVQEEGFVELRLHNPNGGQVTIDDIGWTSFGEPAGPTFFTSTNAISHFGYKEGEGPSDSQSFKLNVANFSNNIDVDFTLSEQNFELSLDADDWVNLSQINGFDGNETTIYARLKAGLAKGEYEDVLTIGSDGLDDVTIELSGAVVGNLELPYTNNFRNADDVASAESQGFVLSNFELVTSAGGYVKVLDEGYIETPTIDFTQYDRLFVSVSITTFGGEYGQKVRFLVSDDDGESYTLFAEYNAPGDYETMTAKIELVDGLDVEVGKIKIVSDASGGGSIRVRDVRFEEPIPFTIAGTQGWRMLSSPTNNSYSDFLDNIWTQGFDGAKTEFGNPNVLHYDTYANELATLSNFNAAMPAGKGIFVYMYQADEPVEDPETGEITPDDGVFPKTLFATGDFNEVDVTAPINSAPHGWSLVGNPFFVNIDYNDLTFTDIYKPIYVYKNTAAGDVDVGDESGGSYYTWNGVTGGLGSGYIDALQGFYVLNEDFDETGSPELNISANALYRKQMEPVSFDLFAEMDGLRDKAFFSFTPNGQLGTDSHDAFKLAPINNYKYLSLGTMVDGAKLDINNLPLEFDGVAEFPILVRALAPSEDGMTALGGTVTLGAENFKNIPENWTIKLNNYNTGEEINLREIESYTFEIQGSKEKAIKPATTPSILTMIAPLKEEVHEETGISISIAVNDTPTATEVDEAPAVFALEQNYPNPFNPATTIKYSVADAGQVNLTVYNVMGQKVAELVNTNKTAGTYTAQWDAKNAASGMYFYKLSSAGQTLTKQMMLIK